jgi:hypothetical protein
MPIREVRSPVNTMKTPKPGIVAASPASRNIQHAPVGGPPAQSPAVPEGSSYPESLLSRPGLVDPFPPPGRAK